MARKQAEVFELSRPGNTKQIQRPNARTHKINETKWTNVPQKCLKFLSLLEYSNRDLRKNIIEFGKRSNLNVLQSDINNLF